MQYQLNVFQWIVPQSHSLANWDNCGNGWKAVTVTATKAVTGACLQEEEHDPAKRLQNAELDDKPKHEDVHQQQQHQPIVQLVIVVMLETGVLPFPGFLKPLTLQKQQGTRANQQAMIPTTEKTEKRRKEKTTCFGVNWMRSPVWHRAAQAPGTHGLSMFRFFVGPQSWGVTQRQTCEKVSQCGTGKPAGKEQLVKDQKSRSKSRSKS